VDQWTNAFNPLSEWTVRVLYENQADELEKNLPPVKLYHKNKYKVYMFLFQN